MDIVVRRWWAWAETEMEADRVTVGSVVWANAAAATGRPYKATVEAVGGGRARVRPLEEAMTMGAARGGRHRIGPSVKARWVRLETLWPCPEAAV